MPLVTQRLRDPDINPCFSFCLFVCFLILFYLLNDASLMSVRNLMLPPDVWMKITMTRKGVPLTS
ncbi:coiled-coil-helix-coiled-coil-helix domain-containing protein 7 isoform X3 [Hylobates moloch]|uniref:coiled-coil-helix-coiled-coil-helix domain-containing protein 7 isoform X3 n=1 Tax=Hylobates moloch TaxID=81572 RepID=UPI0013F21067|nr:coiled-coil-helix-coiled-coil-helix domain-containing protein 7 isoform X3 [Hylobates moloch]